MKQLLGFPHLHSAAQHSRHEDMKMPTSLSEGLSLLSFLCVIPILPQLLPSPPVQRASGCQREMSRVTCASSCECHCCSITHHTQVLQSSSMRPSPGAGHSCPLWRADRAWLRHGAPCQIHGHSCTHTVPGGVLHFPNTASHGGNVCMSFGAHWLFFFIFFLVKPKGWAERMENLNSQQKWQKSVKRKIINCRKIMYSSNWIPLD